MSRTIFCLLLSFFTTCASAQIEAKALGQAGLEEKIFVHTDKDFYLAGEILWFKVYVVDAASHHPLSLSKMAYVEIISKDLRSIGQARIALDEGLGSGSFQLPFSIRSGNYILRAYTNWMKNAGPEIFYEENLTILNTLRDPGLLDTLLSAPASTTSLSTAASATSIASPSPTTSAGTSAIPPPAATAAYDARFFPEGGYMIVGLPGRVAFRIADRDGNPLTCKGAIINPSGDTITRFQSLRFGMGSFTLQPEEGTKYRAVLELDDHRQLVNELPAPEKKGYTLQVSDAGNGQLKIIVRTTNRGEDSLIWLSISSRHTPLSVDKKNISGGGAEFTVEKNTLHEGISCFTVLAGNRKTPVAERLWFTPPAPLKMEVHTAQENYGSRERVTANLSSHDPMGQPVRINGSMAVILLDSLQSIGQDDLLNYLFLSSELKGTIFSPGYYFSGNGPEVQETADLLMMTQGWRRFRHAAAQPPAASSPMSTSSPTAQSSPAPASSPTGDRPPSFPPEYAGILVTGRITDKLTGLPAADVPAWLSAPGNYFHLAYATSDKNGMIQWDLGQLYGEHELVVQTVRPAKDNPYRIDILSPYSDVQPQYPSRELRLAPSVKQQLLWHSIGAQTQNAWQADKRLHFTQPAVTDSVAFYGVPNKRFLLDDYTRFSTMEEVMREYAKETRVRNRNGDFSIFVQSDQANQVFFETSPLVLMDGMPVNNFNHVIQFDPLKIRKMEVVAKRYYLGDTLYSGIISYNTYQGDLAGFPMDSSAIIQEYEGLQVHREFYSPLYETTDQQKSRIADLRNVLYWDPAIRTDAQGSQSLSFYTSDLPGRYAVIVQGITPEGRAGKSVALFTVRPPERR